MNWLFISIVMTFTMQLQARVAEPLAAELPSLKDRPCKALPKIQVPIPSKTDELAPVVSSASNSIHGEVRQDRSTNPRIIIGSSTSVNERTETLLPPTRKDDTRKSRLACMAISKSTQTNQLYTKILDATSERDKEVSLTSDAKTRYFWLTGNNPQPWLCPAVTTNNLSINHIMIKKDYSNQWVKTRDDKGNVIYQYFDFDGRLVCSLDADTYRCRRSMWFQLFLEFLIPWIIEPSFPSLGGWHRWEYSKTSPRQVPKGSPNKGEATTNPLVNQPVPDSHKKDKRQEGDVDAPYRKAGYPPRLPEPEQEEVLPESRSGQTVIRITNKNNENGDDKTLVNNMVASLVALMNSNGGTLITDIENRTWIEVLHLIKKTEQRMGMLMGVCAYTQLVELISSQKNLTFTVKPSKDFVICRSLAYISTETQVEPIRFRSFAKLLGGATHEGEQSNNSVAGFTSDHNHILPESNQLRYKYIEGEVSTLASIITKKQRKVPHTLCAMANGNGGSILLGKHDESNMYGYLLDVETKSAITREVERMFSVMLWRFGSMQKDVHWKLEFKPLVDAITGENTGNDVIVLSVNALKGGVFWGDSESYRVVNGSVEKIPRDEWIKIIFSDLKTENISKPEEQEEILPDRGSKQAVIEITNNNNKKNKKEMSTDKKIANAIVAMMNSDGGSAVIGRENMDSKAVENLTRKVEQKLLNEIECYDYMKLVKRTLDQENLIFTVIPSQDLVTTDTHAYISTEAQCQKIYPYEVVQVLERTVPEGGQYTDLPPTFSTDQNRNPRNSPQVKYRNVKGEASKNYDLADRLLFSCYFVIEAISALANTNGGSIIFGILDGDKLSGYPLNKQTKKKIIYKVEKLFKRMVWRHGEMQKDVHWKLEFKPVVDEITGEEMGDEVIVVSVNALGCGVFTEVPESYYVIDGRVERMLWNEWLSRALPSKLQASPSPSTETEENEDSVGL